MEENITTMNDMNEKYLLEFFEYLKEKENIENATKVYNTISSKEYDINDFLNFNRDNLFYTMQNILGELRPATKSGVKNCFRKYAAFLEERYHIHGLFLYINALRISTEKSYNFHLYTQAEIEEMIILIKTATGNRTYNKHEMFFRCVYEGIYEREFGCLNNLRRSNFKDNKVRFNSKGKEIEFEVTPEFKNDLFMFSQKEVNKVFCNDGNEKSTLLQGLYLDSIFKIQRKTVTEKSLADNFIRIFADIKQYINQPDINYFDIYVSGVWHRIINKANELNIDLRNKDEVGVLLKNELIRIGYISEQNGIISDSDKYKLHTIRSCIYKNFKNLISEQNKRKDSRVVKLKYYLILSVNSNKLLSLQGVPETIKQLSYEISQRNAVFIENIEVNNTSVNYTIEIPPMLSIDEVVTKLKKDISSHLWETRCSDLLSCFWKKGVFWTDGYFISSIGEVSEEMINDYINNQMLSIQVESE